MLVLVAVGAVALAAVSGYNALVLARLRPPGSWYAVNGHRMRIDCTGQGSPTLVLDAGLGNDGLIWGGVQPVLAKTTRVCSYDRAGFGWSDPLPPPRDADHIAQELHGLLAAAHIDGPIVLMGHSIAGIYIRNYATRYPEQVAGLIFVDGSTPLQGRDPAFLKAFGPQQATPFRDLSREAMGATGIPRLHGDCKLSGGGIDPAKAGFDAQAAYLQGEDLCRDRVHAVAEEAGSMDRSGEETVHSGPYGDLPILVFSQDAKKSLAEGEPPEVAEAWSRMQENLKQLSTRGRRIIARDSGHYVQIDRPELIEREVPLFLEQVRTGQGSTLQPATPYGTTVTR